jgi:hypothetical protein
MYSYQALCMHVHTMVPGKLVYGQVMQRRRASFLRFKMGTCQLREKTLTEQHRPPELTGGSHKVDNPAQKNNLSRNPEKARAHGLLWI